jgi:hypothetical protein
MIWSKIPSHATVPLNRKLTEIEPPWLFTAMTNVNVRISDMARISAAFGLFYVLQRNFKMRHYFNDVKVPKNYQDQCEFECLFIFQHFTLFIFF